MKLKFSRKIADSLHNGKVGVLPTDTLYGLVGSALDKKAVKRIYKLRRRDLKKPMIILLAGMSELRRFGIRVPQAVSRVLQNLWPGKISVVLPCPAKKFTYLHRGARTLAFRVPESATLRRLLKKAGPLVAPSANWQGQPPAKTIKQAQKYFGSEVDFYVNAGKREGQPSTLVLWKPKLGWRILRPGAVKIRVKNMVLKKVKG